MKKNARATRIKSMKAAKKKAPYREAKEAIEKKMVEIKEDSQNVQPARLQGSLFRYAF